MERQRLELSGLWRFAPDCRNEGEKAGWFKADQNVRLWREVAVPCSFADCGPELATYEGPGWFVRKFDVPPAWQGKRVLLRFEGVNYHARVWVNGQLVGRHDDGFLRFDLPVEPVLKFGQANTVSVWVDNGRHKEDAPGVKRGWRPYGGILREVELIATDTLYLDRVRVTATPGEPAGQFAVEADVVNETGRAADVTLAVEIADAAGSVLQRLLGAAVSVAAGGRVNVEFKGEVPGAQAWTPDTPVLYTARLSLRSSAGEDGLSVRFGFRKVEVAGGKLLLNGKPIYLTGFNRHEDSPRRNMCTDLDIVRRDLQDMKHMHSNFVRLCHYPHHPGELDLCDEMGLLVMGEIPLYWWSGREEGEEISAKRLATARRQLTALIERDINHPSIIFWSVSNETAEQFPDVVAGNAELVRQARSLDPTRLAVHVSHSWLPPHFDEDDVACVNHYPSCAWEGPGKRTESEIASLTQVWADRLEKLHRACPAKPILVTEFGCPCLDGIFDNAMGEDQQAKVLEAEFAGLGAPYVCGAVIWCYADHPWPEEPFIHYITTSPFGVVSRGRRRFTAWGTVRRMFLQRRGVVEPVRASGGDLDNYPVAMFRPHLRDLPEHPFPEGFGIRPMRRDEGPLWTDIERDAEPFMGIGDEVFASEFGSDLPAVERRCFFIVDSRGVAVGTISGWYSRDYKGKDCGRIHWVAVRRAYQRRGLAKAAMSYVLRQLAAWHEAAWLATSTGRIPAIQMYLDFGFLPDVNSPEAAEAWRRLNAKINHPALKGF